jgi:hypothetical protein
MATIGDLKASAPPETKAAGRKSKFEQSHLSLIAALEGRLEAIDAELAVSVFYAFIVLHEDTGKSIDRIFAVRIFPVRIFPLPLGLHLSASSLTYDLSECKGPGERLNNATIFSHKLKFEKPEQGGKRKDLIMCIATMLIVRYLSIPLFSWRFGRLACFGTQEDADEYVYQEDEEYDDPFDEDDFLNFRADNPNGSSSRRLPAQSGRRRSSRNTVQNANGKRAAPDAWSQWRGERRSSRLGAPADTQLDSDVPSLKRARTEESTVSTDSVGMPSVAASGTSNGQNSNPKTKVHGAAAVKSTETAVEQVAGRKKSKFWYYAVEPIPGTVRPPLLLSNGRAGEPFTNGAGQSDPNEHKGHGNGDTVSGQDHTPLEGHQSRMDYEKSLEGSLSPAPSVDST